MCWFRKILDKLLSGKVILRGPEISGAKITKKKAKTALNVWRTGSWECGEKNEKWEEEHKTLEGSARLETSGEKWTVTISGCGQMKGFLEQRSLVFGLNIFFLMWHNPLLSHPTLIISKTYEAHTYLKVVCLGEEAGLNDSECVVSGTHTWSQVELIQPEQDSTSTVSMYSNHFLLLPPGKSKNPGRLLQFLWNTERDARVRTCLTTSYLHF